MADIKTYRKEIAAIRRELGGDLPPNYDDDHLLYRWVAGWTGDLSTAEDKLRGHLLMREMFELDDPSLGRVDHCSVKGKLVDVLSKIGGFQLPDPRVHDRTGHLLMVYRFGVTDFGLLPTHVRCSDIVWYTMAMGELVSRIVLEESRRLGKEIGTTIIQDLDGLQVTKFISDGFLKPGGVRTSMEMCQEHFPEQTAKVIVINAPKAFDLLWQALQPVVCEEARQKFVVLGKDYRSTLLDHFEADNLPREFGGTLDVEFPLPCREWPAAMEIYGDEKTEPNKLKTVHIKPGKQVRMGVDIPCAQPCHFRWWFRSSSMVRFHVEWNGGKAGVDADEEWSPLRYPLPLASSDFPEFGSLTTHAEGHYRLRFQNESTYLFSMKLEYGIKVFDAMDIKKKFEIVVS